MNKRIKLLNGLDTAILIKQIYELETELENHLTQEATLRGANIGYVANYNDDCAEAKSVLADLSLTPPLAPDGKKATVAYVDAWLKTQRKTNPELISIIERQNLINFKLETLRVNIEMTKKKLESRKAILALRRAQIDFLGGA